MHMTIFFAWEGRRGLGSTDRIEWWSNSFFYVLIGFKLPI